MTRDQFITNYVLVFCAMRSATEYNNACMRGQQERLDRQPVEDAEYLAERAWDQYQKFRSDACGEECGATHNGYMCTLAVKHSGDHIAHGSHREVYARWNQ